MKIRNLLPCAAIALLSACGGGADSGGYYNSSSGGIVSPPPSQSDAGDDLPPLTSGEQYEDVGTNPFVATLADPLSTFGVDVDTASYDIFRRDINNGFLPRTLSVRVEEYINNFSYHYAPPALDAAEPFSITLDSTPQLLERDTHILRVGIQAAAPPAEKKPANLVFLIDVSGSMTSYDKLPLVQEMLVETLDILEPDDRVAIVTYAGSTRVALTSTEVTEKAEIIAAINSLNSGGSTAGAAGITLAYDQAAAGFIPDGINHVILCTDGDFNVGVSSIEALVDLIEEKRASGITFTALGFGTGNLNDAMMERVSNAGNGIYGMISSSQQASRYVEQRMLSNLIYVARDMKVQVEFNPALVTSYRLIGYENRAIDDDDFREDEVDAGEIGAGHNVTALYEFVTTSQPQPEIEDAPPVLDGGIYDGPVEVDVDDYVLVKVRYKAVASEAEDPAFEVNQSLATLATDFSGLDDNLKWAVAVAAFAEILKDSPYADPGALAQLDSIFAEFSGLDSDRMEFYGLFQAARTLLEARAEAHEL